MFVSFAARFLKTTTYIHTHMELQDFPYTPEELSAYAETFGTFVISLKDGSVVKYDPKDVDAFEQWLSTHNVRNINAADN